MVETMRELSLEEMVRVKPGEARGPLFYIEELDYKLPGIAPGRLVVIGGYVGSYKTLMGINIMYNNVVNMLFPACDTFHPSQSLLPPLARKQYRVSPPGIAA
jgi:hypothetical protein